MGLQLGRPSPPLSECHPAVSVPWLGMRLGWALFPSPSPPTSLIPSPSPPLRFPLPDPPSGLEWQSLLPSGRRLSFMARLGLLELSGFLCGDETMYASALECSPESALLWPRERTAMSSQATVKAGS